MLPMRSKGAEIQGMSQTVIKIDVAVKEKMDGFLESDVAHKMGIRSQASLASRAVSEFLEKHAPKEDNDPIRFVLPSLEDDELRIDVHIFKNKVSCNRCIDNKEDCKHVKLLYKDKEVKGHLKNAKIVLPKIKN